MSMLENYYNDSTEPKSGTNTMANTTKNTFYQTNTESFASEKRKKIKGDPEKNIKTSDIKAMFALF
jgi:hypothetical protein